MVLPNNQPNPAPNQHMIGSFLEIGSGWPVNRNKQVCRAITANAGGTTTTLVGANAQSTATTLKIGDRVRLFVAANTLKEATLFTITNIVVAGSTTVTFTPAAAGSTASGDYLSVTQDISDVSVPVNYADIASVDNRLNTINSTVYTQLRLNTMTMNDKLYAERLADDAETVG